MTKSETIGEIRASTKLERFRRSKIIIQSGEMKRSGILGEIVEKIRKLEDAAMFYGNVENDKNYAILKAARWNLFLALEKLQKFSQ